MLPSLNIDENARIKTLSRGKDAVDHGNEQGCGSFSAIGVVAILVSVGLYFLSEYLIRRKLNLD